LNTRSLCNKTVGVFELLSDHNIEVGFLTETWLRKGDSSKIAEIKDLGFNIIHHSRPGRGGGVAIAYKKNLTAYRRASKSFGSFEHIECTMASSGNELLRLVCIYRSCTAALSTVSNFCHDFDDYLDELIQLPGKLIIAGDFNIHVEDPQDPDTCKFKAVLDRHNLRQWVDSPTHTGGGTLDLVLTRSHDCDAINISNTEVHSTATSSDHLLVKFSCTFSHELGQQRILKTGRCIKHIDISSFKEDISNSALNNPEEYFNCDNAVNLYNSVLQSLLDKHAPLQEFSVSVNQSVWIDSNCQEAKRKRRKAERDSRRLKTLESKAVYNRLCKDSSIVINQTRDNYYKRKLEIAETKKDVYRTVNYLMDRDLSKTMMPNCSTDEKLCEQLKTFFHEKVETIYSNIDKQQKEDVRPDLTTPKTSKSWDKFTEITDSDLKSIFSEINKKECDEDPIPVKLLLDCFEELTPIILFIVNDSLRTGRFPTGLKNALVRPVIKDKGGDVNSFKNYRPISNLTFLSKVIEKCVQKELSAYLEANNLHASHQSGYRANHSCETATLKIYNDLLCLSDSKNKVVLLLLDLSAAFDTVNHNILISKLKNEFGLKGEVLDWFKSYLADRSFTVSINGKLSSKCFLKVGVPQGSILGPILFILYTKELNSIAQRHGFHIHLYADDTQLYIEFNPLYENLSNIEQRIIACLNDIKNWMKSNKLKLNQDKTEILIVQTKNNFSSWTVPSITLSEEGETLNTSPVVKSLGVLFDEFLTFEDHVDAIVKSCNIHLRNLRVIGSKLNYELKRQLVHCLVFSKLDYCNSLLYGLPDYIIKKLQKVQNSCVRFLFGHKTLKKWDSVTPYLKQAHFLPIKQRIKYKIALTVFKCINNEAPPYITSCISMKDEPRKCIRTCNDFFLLQVPSVTNYQRTERGFTYSGPEIWNQLPYELRTLTNISAFKKGLKTWLFCEAFSDV